MEKEEILAIKFVKWFMRNVDKADSLNKSYFKKNQFDDGLKALNAEDWYKLFIEHRKKLEEELSLEKD